jgi:hypothetical protein
MYGLDPPRTRLSGPGKPLKMIAAVVKGKEWTATVDGIVFFAPAFF